MNADPVKDALDGMSAKQLERMRELIDRRLASCVIDGTDGAVPVRCTAKMNANSLTFTLLLCPACIEKHRLPESRSEA
ncbi:MAG: hypothetical protein ACOYB2_11035 [Limnohabitans sp.]